MLLTLLGIEGLAISAAGHTWLPLGQPMAAPIVFLAALLWFGRSRLRSAPRPHFTTSHLSVGTHVLAAAALLSLEILLHRNTMTQPPRLAVLSWVVALLALIGSLVTAFFPPRFLAALGRRLGVVWLYALGITCGTMAARVVGRLCWDDHSPLAHVLVGITFAATRMVLLACHYQVISDPAHAVLGTPAFNVEVTGACSGTEGLSLVLVLALSWIAYTRREIRVGRALALVPLAAVAMWMCNALRIALLIAIGNAGHPDVAVTGFHSEAGWIAFTLIAVSFLTAASRMPWLQRVPRQQTAAEASNPTAAFLLPFLAILLASMLAHAVSAGFEWLYPLRFVAAAAPLWIFRKYYRDLDWRAGGLAAAVGVLIGLAWVAYGYHARPATDALAASLDGLGTPARVSWIAFRALAAIVTVPIAEELAFRGFLARRLVSENFEAVPFSALGLTSIAASSIIFGALHGHFWWLGTIAGAAFALGARRSGRFGDAVLAHAAANAVIAACVLTRHAFWLW